MKIFYDGQAFESQRAGGVSRVFAEIISGLPADWEPVLACSGTFGAHAPHHPNLKLENYRLWRPHRLSRRFYQGWKPPSLNRCAVSHPTYYDLLHGVRYSDFKGPLVVTVYDFIFARFPGQLDDAKRTLAIQAEAIERADHIVCISRSTQGDLAHFHPKAMSKSSVIGLASSFAHGSLKEPASAAERIDPEAPTFLFVGGRGGYKNFSFLLRAFAKARSKCPRIRLHVAGHRLDNEERWAIHLLGLDGSVDATVYPDEQALAGLYRRSVALLYPSFYEGFGLPPLEAMSCGTLAVTSNATSLPEVVGDAGIMLDPFKEDDWAECLLDLARGKVDRNQYIARGYEHAQRFTWRQSVSEHVALYRRLAA